MVGQHYDDASETSSDFQPLKFVSEASQGSRHSGTSRISEGSSRGSRGSGRGQQPQQGRRAPPGSSSIILKHPLLRDPLQALWHQNLYDRGDRFRNFTEDWLKQSYPQEEETTPRSGEEEEGSGSGSGNAGQEGEESEEEDGMSRTATEMSESLYESENPAVNDGLTWQDEAPAARDGLTWLDEEPAERAGSKGSRPGRVEEPEEDPVPSGGLNVWLRAHDSRRDPMEAKRALALQAKAAAEAKARASAKAIADAPRPAAVKDWYMVDDPRDGDGPWCWRADFVAEVLAQVESHGMAESKLAVTEAGKALRICRRIPPMAQAFTGHLDVVCSNGRRELWSRAFAQSLDVALELATDTKGRKRPPLARLHREDLLARHPGLTFVRADAPILGTAEPRPQEEPKKMKVPKRMKNLYEDYVGGRPSLPPLPLRLPTKVLYNQHLPWTRIMWNSSVQRDGGSPRARYVSESERSFDQAMPRQTSLDDWPVEPVQRQTSSFSTVGPLMTAGSMNVGFAGSGSAGWGSVGSYLSRESDDASDQGGGVGSFETTDRPTSALKSALKSSERPLPALGGESADFAAFGKRRSVQFGAVQFAAE